MPLPLPATFTSGVDFFLGRTTNITTTKIQLNKEVLVGNGPNLPTLYVWGTFGATGALVIQVSALDAPNEATDADWVELPIAAAAADPSIVEADLPILRTISERSVWIRAKLTGVTTGGGLNAKIL